MPFAVQAFPGSRAAIDDRLRDTSLRVALLIADLELLQVNSKELAGISIFLAG